MTTPHAHFSDPEMQRLFKEFKTLIILTAIMANGSSDEILHEYDERFRKSELALITYVEAKLTKSGEAK